jgi:RNA polymerase sigma-70 factor (ECF subfamily)
MIRVMPDLDHLLKFVPASDPQVSEALVDAHYGYIYRLSLSILNDPDEAEDAAQETFINAIMNLDHYQAGTHLKSWLSTIAINICRDMLRRRKARQALQGVLQGLRLQSGHPPTPEDSAVQNEGSRRLWQAVQSLNEKHRLPILLRYVHGLPVNEIAQVLNLSEGTVHSRLHYAVRKLQDRLGRMETLTEAGGGEWGKGGPR